MSRAIWSWRGDAGWQAYDEDVTHRLETAYAASGTRASLRVTIRGVDYAITHTDEHGWEQRVRTEGQQWRWRRVRREEAAEDESPRAPRPRPAAAKADGDAAAKGDGKGDGKKDEAQWRWCAVCGEKLMADHPGVYCMNSHHLCSDCSAIFKDSLMKEPSIDTFPPKCGFCACEVNLQSFERQLDDDERGTFLTMMVLKQLPEDEVMMSCPHCPFFCTRRADASEAIFIHCQAPSCLKVSCRLCSKECVPIDGDGEEEEDDEAVQLGMAEHFQCAEKEGALGGLRREFEAAIDSGIKPACPKCKLGGIKDEGDCCHMTCESCSTEWCYVCGLDVDSPECSKAAGGGEAHYRHNSNWVTREDRCPMYLSQISEVDDTWPEDDEDAMAKLNNIRALRNLRKLFDRIGQAEYRKLVEAYPTLGAASGFTEEEILKVDLSKPIFRRADPGFFDGSDSEGEDEPDSD
jgi:hypothetical protein